MVTSGVDKFFCPRETQPGESVSPPVDGRWGSNRRVSCIRVPRVTPFYRDTGYPFPFGVFRPRRSREGSKLRVGDPRSLLASCNSVVPTHTT